jgi:hypothetical protein
MPDPLRLAAAAIELTAAHYGRADSRTTTTLALVAVGIASAGGGGGFAIAALLLYLIPILGPAGATLVVASTLLALAGLAFMLANFLAGRSGNRRPRQLDLQALATDAEDFIRDHKAPALAAALLAGLLAGDERPGTTEDWPRRNPS